MNVGISLLRPSPISVEKTLIFGEIKMLLYVLNFELYIHF